LATQHPALLLVDEAHATGTHGPAGAGLVAELGLQADVNLCMGTLSKALGSYGGFVCCSHSMKELLVNQARTFLFATALPPAAIGAALGALDVLRDEPERAKRLHHLADELRAKLVGAGWDVLGSTTQIIPVLVKDNARAMALADRLRSEGMEVAAIRPPTVPEGTARLRLSVSAAHRPEDIRRLLDILGTNS
jgi:7-keto-8-aminopelargonate synthetase-like enzyme